MNLCEDCSADSRYCGHGTPVGPNDVAVRALAKAAKVDTTYVGCIDAAAAETGLLRSFVADCARRYQTLWMGS